MRDRIDFEGLIPGLKEGLIELKHGFLKEMLIKASRNKEPQKDQRFIEKLGLSFNRQAKRNVGFDALLRKNRAIGFKLLIKLQELSGVGWHKIEENILTIRLGRHDGKVSINFPIKSDKALGSIVGHILGDGSIDKRYSQVFFTNKNKHLINEFYRNMNLVFGIKGRIWLQKSGNFKVQSKWIRRIQNPDEIPEGQQVGLFYPSICGVILNHTFGNFARGNHKEITKEILASPKEFKVGVIRAFFDDEGYVDKQGTLRFHQDRKQILEGIKTLLSDVGIESRPIHFYIRKEKARHFFNIAGKENHKKYRETIGCTIPYKQEGLVQLSNRDL